MPKINRSTNVYVELPEELATKSIGEARLQISLNITVPKEFEGKKLDEFVNDQMNEVSKSFKKWIHKRSEKLTD